MSNQPDPEPIPVPPPPYEASPSSTGLVDGDTDEARDAPPSENAGES